MLYRIYSLYDYHTITLCRTREKAQKISELFGGTFEAYKDGEKWDTDSPVRSIVFDRNFKLIKCTLECGAKEDFELDKVFEKETYISKYYMYISAPSEEQAIKAARNLLTKHIGFKLGLNEKAGEI